MAVIQDGLIGTLAQVEPTILAVSVADKQSAQLVATAGAAANTQTTATLPAAGAGLFHYITSIVIQRAATAALVGGATINITTTNLNGATWTVGNAMAAGGSVTDLNFMPSKPWKSQVANTASTIVFPAAGAAVLSRITVTYYTGP